MSIALQEDFYPLILNLQTITILLEEKERKGKLKEAKDLQEKQEIIRKQLKQILNNSEKKEYLNITNLNIPNILPTLTLGEIRNRYEHVKPIHEVEYVKYFFKEYKCYQLAELCYLKRTPYDITEVADITKLKEVKDIICFHNYKNPDDFSPTIAEVLKQIPEDLLSCITHFEIIDSISTEEELNKYRELIKNKFHVSRVATYRYEN